MTKKTAAAPAEAALVSKTEEKTYPDNLPEAMRGLHDKLVGAKVLMLKGHPHEDRVGMIDRMEKAHAISKWGFIVRFNNDRHDEAFVFEGKHLHIIEEPKPKEPAQTGKPNQRKFEVYGKTRIIRDVRVDKKDQFEAYYRNHFIYIYLDGHNELSADCTGPNGGYIVNGVLVGSIDEGIKECLENILYEEKNRI